MELAMATAAKIVSYPHIEKTPEVRGGKACIEGTRIAVVDIVLLHKRGLSPQEMLGYYARPLRSRPGALGTRLLLRSSGRDRGLFRGVPQGRR